MDNRPIGVFDSGVGGLSILKAIHDRLPKENTIYFADQAYLPYGEKTSAEILARARKVSQFLINQNAKLIVIACNTATVFAINTLRKEFETPFVGVIPPIKPGVKATKTNEIIIFATKATSNSKTQTKLIKQFAGKKIIHIIPIPKLVEFIETGDLSPEPIKVYLKEVVSKFQLKHPDVIILGCTHYPFAEKIIKASFPQAKLIQPAYPVASQVQNVLKQRNLLTTQSSRKEQYFTTGENHRFHALAQKLLNKKISRSIHVNV